VVIQFNDYCPRCGWWIGPMSGLITGYANPGLDDIPGPYYHVLIAHECDGGAQPIYGESELLRVATL
jgi:hypothetical protein